MKSRLKRKIISVVFGPNTDKEVIDKTLKCRKHDHALRCFYAVLTKHRKKGLTIYVELRKEESNESTRFTDR